MKSSIYIITCWYGPYPWYFPYFIHSCSFNPTVDFFIITDNNEHIPHKPSNVIIVHKTLYEIRTIASQKLGLTANIDYAYKLCNFLWNDLAEGKSILELERKIDSFTYLIKSAGMKKEIRAHFDFILLEGEPGRIVFDNGKIIYKNQFEGILYHLFGLKKIVPKRIPNKIPDRYYISPARIYHSRKDQRRMSVIT